uniref:Uncharacterized protein n=1 Tax=Anguilla anguilla TaxID=7936 RepID=A0A0E9WWF1_ANGAN
MRSFCNLPVLCADRMPIQWAREKRREGARSPRLRLGTLRGQRRKLQITGPTKGTHTERTTTKYKKNKNTF